LSSTTNWLGQLVHNEEVYKHCCIVAILFLQYMADA